MDDRFRVVSVDFVALVINIPTNTDYVFLKNSVMHYFSFIQTEIHDSFPGEWQLLFHYIGLGSESDDKWWCVQVYI